MPRRHKKRRHGMSKTKKWPSVPIIEYAMPNIIPVGMKIQLHRYNGCDTPAKLYKFEPPAPERLSALVNGLAYFSSPKFFNDTKDCGLMIDCNLSDEDLRAALSNSNEWLKATAPWELRKSPSHLSFDKDANRGFSIQYFRSIRDEFKRGGLTRVKRLLRVLADAAAQPVNTGGIYCVTDNWRNEVMWKNYARGGTGYVLEFEPQTCPVCWDAGPVKYVDSFSTIKLYTSAMSGTVVRDLLRVPMTKLRDPWESECEWRTWRRAPGFYRYPHSSLISITFGPQMDPRLQCGILASFIAKYGLRMRFYEAKYSQGQMIRIPI